MVSWVDGSTNFNERVFPKNLEIPLPSGLRSSTAVELKELRQALIGSDEPEEKLT
jgi:hypothetical protein